MTNVIDNSGDKIFTTIRTRLRNTPPMMGDALIVNPNGKSKS